MALSSLLRKMPSLGFRSPPMCPLMGPVRVLSPAAGSRLMSHGAPGGQTIQPEGTLAQQLESINLRRAELGSKFVEHQVESDRRWAELHRKWKEHERITTEKFDKTIAMIRQEAAAGEAYYSEVTRFPHRSRNMVSIGEVKDDQSSQPGLLRLMSSANVCSPVIQGMKNIQMRGITLIAPCVDGILEDGVSSVTDDQQVVFLDSDDEEMNYPIESVFPLHVLPNSRHRCGSIHSSIWNQIFHVSNRKETRLEAMMNTDPTADCFWRNGTCMVHPPRCMLQIFSLKLAKIPVNSGSVELYGYIAVRDNLDQLLNYVVNFSRDDPIIVEQGSLINMNGPKRAIHLIDTILVEYDLKIKTGEQEKDDLQLIDGLSAIDDTGVWNCLTLTRRIHGDCGAVDITFLRLERAVEGTVEVSISEVKCSFSLSLCCFINGLNDEIRLFDGIIGESSVLKRSVVAVTINSWMELKFKVGSESSSSSEACSFYPSIHGLTTQQIKTEFAVISVKVTWSTLSSRRFI